MSPASNAGLRAVNRVQPIIHGPRLRHRVSMGSVVALIASLHGVAAPETIHRGGERIIYRDPETGRTVWRMTASTTNDKHCYYNEQPWNHDMSKILWSSGKPTATSKTG